MAASSAVSKPSVRKNLELLGLFSTQILEMIGALPLRMATKSIPRVLRGTTRVFNEAAHNSLVFSLESMRNPLILFKGFTDTVPPYAAPPLRVTLLSPGAPDKTPSNLSPAFLQFLSPMTMPFLFFVPLTPMAHSPQILAGPQEAWNTKTSSTI